MVDVIQVLIIEDRQEDAELVMYELRQAGIELEWQRVETEREYLAALEPAPDVILADYSLPQFDVFRAMRLLREHALDIPFIIVTGSIGEEQAVECMRMGAADYLLKDRLARLGEAVRQALEKKQLHEEKQQAEDELLQAYQELQEADKLKSQMIQNVSHELRTPLSYLVGYTGLMLDSEYSLGPLTEEQRDSLQVMSRQAERLTRLVDNIVSIQRAQNHALNQISVDVATFLEHMLQRSALAAAENEITLTARIPNTLPKVLIDRMAVDQVLDNLMSNAFKFTPPGGEVTVEARTYDGGNEVQVSISDTGIGIPEEEHDRIFGRFYQVDGSSQRTYQGLGVGLAVCREIIKLHGGEIRVESANGQGSTFSFTLPTSRKTMLH